jgi:hypothetical protein
MAVRLWALRAGRPLPPGRFLVPICVRGRVDPRAILRLEGLDKLKKSNDLIGNRNRYLPACSTVPQPTTLPRALRIESFNCKNSDRIRKKEIFVFIFFCTSRISPFNIPAGRRSLTWHMLEGFCGRQLYVIPCSCKMSSCHDSWKQWKSICDKTLMANLDHLASIVINTRTHTGTHTHSFVSLTFVFAIAQLRFTIATRYRPLTCCINMNYVVHHKRAKCL